MKRTTIPVALLILAASGLTIGQVTHAQIDPATPSTPEFSLNFVNDSI
jgi:hypothetical protein